MSEEQTFVALTTSSLESKIKRCEIFRHDLAKKDIISTTYLLVDTHKEVVNYQIAIIFCVENKYKAISTFENPFEGTTEEEVLEKIYKSFMLLAPEATIRDFYFNKYEAATFLSEEHFLLKNYHRELSLQTREEFSAMSIVIANNKVLVLKTVDNLFVLPKGHLEVGETSLQAAIRECEEEAGIILNSEEHVGEVTGFDYSFSGANFKYLTLAEFRRRFNTSIIHKHIYAHVFLLSEERKPLVKEVHLFAEAIWMPVEELLKLSAYKNQTAVVAEAISLIKKETNTKI